MEPKEGLPQRHCQPCEGIGQVLGKDKVTEFLKGVPGWELAEDGKCIQRHFHLRNFMAAIKLLNKVAEIAESENHHPDLHLTGYRKLKIELSTHALGGLSENDFIVAAKINELPLEQK